MKNKSFCGRSTCYGHGDSAVCGKPYYDEDRWQCDSCKVKEYEQENESLKKEIASSKKYGQ